MLQVNEGKFLNIFSNKNKNYGMFEKIKSLEKNYFKKNHDKSFINLKIVRFKEAKRNRFYFVVSGMRLNLESWMRTEKQI